MFPHIWSLMIREPVQSLFLATFPMALSTIISESSSLSQSGYNSTSLTMFLWILCHSLEQQNAAWLLPVVPPIVSGSCGAVLVNAMIKQSHKNATVTVAASAVMVVIGLGLSTLLVSG
ncbi:hypothetical protein CPB86DRAFT_575191 [Serendipita vermifera]|nr:hypothetical protein CPB86DRAFT_575191 [Serendipita vermifera]